MTIEDTTYHSQNPAAFAEGAPIEGPHATDDGLRQLAENVNVLAKLATGQAVAGGTCASPGHDHSTADGGAALRIPHGRIIGYPAQPFFAATYATLADYTTPDSADNVMSILRAPRWGMTEEETPGGTTMDEIEAAALEIYLETTGGDFRTSVAPAGQLPYIFVRSEDGSNDGRYLVRLYGYPKTNPASGVPLQTGGILVTPFNADAAAGFTGHVYRIKNALLLSAFSLFIPQGSQILNVYVPVKALFDVRDNREGNTTANILVDYVYPSGDRPAPFDLWLGRTGGANGPVESLQAVDVGASDLSSGDQRTKQPEYVKLTYDVSAITGATHEFSLHFQFNSTQALLSPALHSQNFALWTMAVGADAGPPAPIVAVFE